ncbi:copia protein [Tanacetum coccineum]
MTIIGTKWVFRNKLDENGIVSRNKARLVAQGYNQQEGINYDETYAIVARLESIRILLAYVCALDFKLFQMGVKSAFLNDFINKEVYVAQLPGFIDFEKPDHVYKLKKALYGLKQAPKAWAILEPWRQRHGLPPSPPSPPPNRTTPTSPIFNNTLSSSSPPQNSTQNLNEIHHLSNLLDINLQQEIEATNPSPPISPYIPPHSLYQDDAFWKEEINDEIGSIMENNTWVLSDLPHGCKPLEVAYWAQARPSGLKAEYRGVANVVAETCWLWNLLRELNTPLSFVTLVYCDNVRVLHVPSRYQYVGIFIKGLPFALFEEFRTGFSDRVVPQELLNCGEC